MHSDTRSSSFFNVSAIITLYVIKRNEQREDFKPNNIREGIKKACWKRPVTEDEINELIGRVESQIENGGERDIPTEQIGGIIMDELKNVDEIAYVRFASVYRKFKDVDQFIKEIENLKEELSK